MSKIAKTMRHTRRDHQYMTRRHPCPLLAKLRENFAFKHQKNLILASLGFRFLSTKLSRIEIHHRAVSARVGFKRLKPSLFRIEPGKEHIGGYS